MVYVLTKTIAAETLITGESVTVTNYGEIVAMLYPSGLLRLYPGFSWDGATGAFDDDQNLKPSAVHDALYSMIEMGDLPFSCRRDADRTLFALMLPKNTWAHPWKTIRAWYHFAAVRLFGWLRL